MQDDTYTKSRMKKQVKKKIKTMFCPKCESIDVEKEMTMTLILGIPQEWKCNKCGFKGYIFPERDVEV